MAEMWGCPDCGFSFDAVHEDEGGGYSCPACAETKLRDAMVEIERITWREGNSRHDLSRALIDVRKIARSFASPNATEDQ